MLSLKFLSENLPLQPAGDREQAAGSRSLATNLQAVRVRDGIQSQEKMRTLESKCRQRSRGRGTGTLGHAKVTGWGNEEARAER